MSASFTASFYITFQLSLSLDAPFFIICLFPSVVTFKFSQPMIMVLESSGYGTLCVSRTGAIDRAVSLMVTGGGSIVPPHLCKAY